MASRRAHGGRLDARAGVWSNGRFEVTQVKRALSANLALLPVLLLAACIHANSTLIFEIELLSIAGK
jgi:hypothetical protein